MHDVATQTYNGWANRETGLVSLWLHNDPLGESILHDVERACDADSERAEELQRIVLEEYFEDPFKASLEGDLLGTALARVDWFQVVTDQY